MDFISIIIVIIQAMLLIDEKARILRNLVWFILIILLKIREIITKEIIKLLVIMLNINKVIGIIFCHVRINKAFNHDNPSIISGNQKWKGAIPILVNRAEFIAIMNLDGGTRLLIINDSFSIMMTAIKITEEAIACVIKYLIDASEDIILFFLYIRGIIDRRLISNPIHIPNQEYAEMPIKVLDKRRVMNTILYIFVIKKRNNFINRVWT